MLFFKEINNIIVNKKNLVIIDATGKALISKKLNTLHKTFIL